MPSEQLRKVEKSNPLVTAEFQKNEKKCHILIISPRPGEIDPYDFLGIFRDLLLRGFCRKSGEWCNFSLDEWECGWEELSAVIQFCKSSDPPPFLHFLMQLFLRSGSEVGREIVK